MQNALSLGMSDLQLMISNQCDTWNTDVSLVVKNCQIPNIITPNGDLNNDVFYTIMLKYMMMLHRLFTTDGGEENGEKPITEMIGMEITMELLQMAPTYILSFDNDR